MQTKTIEFIENGYKYRLTAKYGLNTIGNQEPYFSMTADLDIWGGGKWREHSGGCLHDEIEKRLPELAKYIKWHLCFSSAPMHYEANALFWLEENNMDNFNHTVVYGAIDEKPLPEGKDTVSAWLKERLPRLMEQFNKDMAELGL